jgi:hypothetical protein
MTYCVRRQNKSVSYNHLLKCNFLKFAIFFGPSRARSPCNTQGVPNHRVRVLGQHHQTKVIQQQFPDIQINPTIEAGHRCQLQFDSPQLIRLILVIHTPTRLRCADGNETPLQAINDDFTSDQLSHPIHLTLALLLMHLVHYLVHVI